MDVEDDEADAHAEAGPSGVGRGTAVKKPRMRTRTVGKRNRAAKGAHSAGVCSQRLTYCLAHAVGAAHRCSFHCASA